MLLQFDAAEVKKSIQILHPNEGELFEIRLIGKNPHYAASGIFNNADTAVNALCNYRAGYKKEEAAKKASIYISINPPVQDCYSLEQHDKFIEGVSALNDSDIAALNWLFIDFDPKRRSGVSSTDSEITHADYITNEVHNYLASMKFSEPICAMSGNGFHLMYRLDNLENNEENVKLLENTLKAISSRFSDDAIEIDVVNFNPSRICKLWGTKAQKGADTSERPHRFSKIEWLPEDGVKANSIELLKEVIKDCTPSTPVQQNVTIAEPIRFTSKAQRTTSTFDVEEFISKHGIEVMGTHTNSGDIFYKLKKCVFDPTHTNNDAAIIKRADGTLCYKCFHNSCKDKGWRDVRRKYEPDAYNKSKSKTKSEDKVSATLLTVDTFTEFCKEHGFSFKWDSIKNEMNYFGFDKGENLVTLPNTAPTILQGILKENKYTGATIENICNCIQVVGTRNTYNAILNKIHSSEWDGKDRIKQIFEMWHISEDDTLSCLLIVKWLKQCYCMLHNNIENPFSSEFALVFIGGQGAAKTRFFERLAMINKYYGEGKSINPDNKDSIMQATTVWICELGEIGSTMKKDLDKVKAFMTLATDEYRVPYGRTTERHPRITSFCGTVNDEQFLLDQSGNRRWGTIRLPERLKVSYDEQIKPFNAEQLWAQIKVMVENDLQNGLTYANCFRLTQDESEQLSERNNSYTKPMKGFIEVRDILEDIENDVPKGYVLRYHIISATGFKDRYDVLRNFSSNQIGQVLQKLGYKQEIRKVDRKTVRGYNLPYHHKTDYPD